MKREYTKKRTPSRAAKPRSSAEYKRRYQNAIERQERYKRFRRNPAYTQAIRRMFGRDRH